MMFADLRSAIHETSAPVTLLYTVRIEEEIITAVKPLALLGFCIHHKAHCVTFTITCLWVSLSEVNDLPCTAES